MSRQHAITAANKNINEGLTICRVRSKFEFNLEIAKAITSVRRPKNEERRLSEMLSFQVTRLQLVT